MSNFYPGRDRRLRGRNYGQVPAFSKGLPAVAAGFQAPAAFAAAEEISGGAMVAGDALGIVGPVLQRLFPWLTALGLAWLAVELLNDLIRGMGNSSRQISGGFTMYNSPCPTFPRGDDLLQSSVGQSQSSYYASICNLSTYVPGNATLTATTQSYQLGQRGNFVGGFFQDHISQVWFRPPALATVARNPWAPRVQNVPFEVGRTYPLGDPGVDPMVLPSLFPEFGPHVKGVPAAVPFPSIPEFDRMAQFEWSPYIHREVGPGPGSAPWQQPDVFPDVPPGTSPSSPTRPSPGPGTSPPTAPFLPPQVDPTEPSPVPWPPLTVSPAPGAPPGTGKVVVRSPGTDIEPSTGGQPARLTPTDGSVQFAPTSPGRKERKLQGSNHAIRVLLFAATLTGGTIRNLHRSLPKRCKSRKGSNGKRRYSTMLADVYRCLDAVDTGKFAALQAETLYKYFAEGLILRKVNAASTASGYGLATNLYHAMGPDVSGPDQGLPSPHGGPFSGRQDPFAAFGAGLGEINRLLGL